MEFKSIFSIILSALMTLFSPTSQVAEEVFLPEAENDSLFVVMDENYVTPMFTYSYPASKEGTEEFAEALKAKTTTEEIAADNISDWSLRLDAPYLEECGFKIYLYNNATNETYMSRDGNPYPIYDAYLMYGDDLYPFSQHYNDDPFNPISGVGSCGLGGLAAADLNGDGIKELYFSGAWSTGYGILTGNPTELWCFDPVSSDKFVDIYQGFYNGPKFMIPVTDENGNLKIYNGWGDFVDGKFTVTVYSEYGEVVYENGEYQLKPYNE